jgi:hypothetical protein
MPEPSGSTRCNLVEDGHGLLITVCYVAAIFCPGKVFGVADLCSRVPRYAASRA